MRVLQYTDVFFNVRVLVEAPKPSPGGIRLQKQRRRDGKEVWVQARSWTVFGTGFGAHLMAFTVAMIT